MPYDPQRSWWDALEQGGYEPHGQLHDFRARCPLCASNNPEALHVFVGADGRAVPWCFACQGKFADVARAAGLHPRDSFPAGHHSAHRRSLDEPVRFYDFAGPARTVAQVLLGLCDMGGEWYVEVRCDCAHCGSPAALIQARSDLDKVLISCPGDDVAEELGYTACTFRQFSEALAAQVEDRRAA